MGQKVSPIAFRLGVIRESDSVWYMDKRKYADAFHADRKARVYIRKTLGASAKISKIVIERPSPNNAVFTISAGNPAPLIGRKGEEVEKLKLKIAEIMGVSVHINIQEVKKPDVEAILVSMSIAQQLEKRVVFRRAIKKAMSSAMRQGAKGIKIAVSGRLGGAEIARTEWMREGQVPLHTLRADIDYGFYEAKTTAGITGVKVWIYKGEVLPRRQIADDKTQK